MGFAFVYFMETDEAKEVQISLNGTNINRRIVIKFPVTDPEWEYPQTFSDRTPSSNSLTPLTPQTTPCLIPNTSSDLKEPRRI